MANYILVGIDGTSSRNWHERDGGNSHVHNFVRRFNTRPDLKRYFAGPNLPGGNVDSIKQGVIRFVQTAIRNNSPLADIRVCLVGHSRGGFIAMLAADELTQAPYPVYFMGLYDAVARTAHGTWPQETISNAEFIYHAVRSSTIGSRPLFGHTGRTVRSGKYIEKRFDTSHGGIGGDPNLGYDETDVFADDSCYRPERVVYTPNTRLTLRGHDYRQLCKTNSDAADIWMRDSARSKGLPV